jgi:threonine/homoserine efflux transporter RhtA
MGLATTRDSFVRQHPLAVAAALYAVLCVPMYFWLKGPVGDAGTVSGSVVVSGLVVASIMFIPVLQAGIRRLTDPNLS